VSQADQIPGLIEPGLLMQKVIPPRLVEPYLTGRRVVIAGFVYRAQETSFASPAEYDEALDLGYEGSGFGPGLTELYALRWNAIGTESYLVPFSANRGGSFAAKLPFTGTGYTSSRTHPVAEFFLDPIPVPVGAEIYRITPAAAEFIARFDGRAWLHSAGGTD
jgi:hypothetical protein